MALSVGAVVTGVAGVRAVHALGELPGTAGPTARDARIPPFPSPLRLHDGAWPRRVEAALASLGASSARSARVPVVHASSPPPSLSADIRGDSLHRRLRQIVARRPEGTFVSVHVRDLETGQTLFDHEGDRLRNPASTQKLFTATAAVELLGPDYRFETRLYRDGDTLYLQGEGDPSLLLDDLYDLVARAHLDGQTSPISTIVVDDHAFSPARFGPGYASTGPDPSYLAPSGALSANFNTIEVVVPGAREAPIEITPRSTTVRVEDRTNHHGGTLRVDTELDDDGKTTVVVVRGRRPRRGAQHTERRRILAPAAFTGGIVADLVAAIGAQAPPSVERGTVPASLKPVAVHTSARLVSVLRSALTFSNNFSIEQVLRTLAWRATGAPGSWEAGIAVLERYWAAIGGDLNDIVVVNAAGLSQRGRLHARGLVRLLDRIRRPGTRAHLLASSMARPGLEGTMARRLHDVGEFMVAKTGTLSGHSALAGMLQDPSGARPIGFAILVDGARTSEARRVQDSVARALHRHLEASTDPP